MVSLISVDILGKRRENWVWGGKSPKAIEANDANEVLLKTKKICEFIFLGGLGIKKGKNYR